MRTIVAAMVLLGSVQAAWGETGFTVHAGEWQTTMSTGAAAPSVHLMCRKTDRQMTASSMSKMMGRMAQHCSTVNINQAGDTMTYDVACEVGGGHMTMHGTLTRTGPDAVTAHTLSHMSGGQFQMPDMDMTVTSRRLGPCQPGDMPEPDLEHGGSRAPG